MAHFCLAAALAHFGRHKEARAAVQAGLALNPSFTVTRFHLVEEVAATDGCRPFRRNSAQSPPRFDTATLGPIRPVLVMPNLCLKLSHPAFSGSNLPGKFFSHFYGLLAICLSSTSRSVQQAQNCLACLSNIASFGPTVRFRKGERRHLLRLYCDYSWHSNNHPVAQEECKFITQTALRQFDPLWITLFGHGCGFPANSLRLRSLCRSLRWPDEPDAVRKVVPVALVRCRGGPRSSPWRKSIWGFTGDCRSGERHDRPLGDDG
jgi:hypothetical protein